MNVNNRKHMVKMKFKFLAYVTELYKKFKISRKMCICLTGRKMSVRTCAQLFRIAIVCRIKMKNKRNGKERKEMERKKRVKSK